MTHLHGSSLFLLPVGGKVQAAKALLYKMTCRNCFSLSRPPKKVCLNKHTCFFLTSLCMRVILISVN